MPSAPQNQNSGRSAEVAPQDKSDNQFLKDGGYRHMNDFMQSYGLKMHDHGDVQEAKSILEGLRQADQADYEARQQEQGQRK